MLAVPVLNRDLSTKLVLPVALVLGLLVGILSASLGTAAAQDMAPAHYVVQTGGGGPANIDLLQFAPQNLKVHRGDVVSWAINGFHTVDVGTTTWPDLVVMADVDGTQTPTINPAIAFPSGAENGSAFQGDQSASGLFLDPNVPPIFTLMMDVDAGTYNYLCDVHPGMAGSIEVVGNDVAIPSPSDVSLQAAGEFGGTVGALMGQFGELEASEIASDTMAPEINAGNPGINRGTINLYFPNVAVAQVGQPVTWTVPQSSIEPHTVSWPPVRNQDVVPVDQPNGPPILKDGAHDCPHDPERCRDRCGRQLFQRLADPWQQLYADLYRAWGLSIRV